MKYLMWLLWLFIPRQDTAAAGESEGDGAETAGEGEEKPAKPLGGSDPEGRPDWLPEKFWNADMKEPRAEVLAKSFTELEAKLRTKTDDLKAELMEEMRAAAPEKYEIELSEDLKIPDNVNLDLSEEDPLVKWFFGFAKENGMSQELVTKALNEYVGIEMANMPDVAAEIAKLGDHGQDRLLRVHNWLESRLSEEQFKSMNPLLSQASQVEALEALMKSSGPSDFEGDSGGQPLTLEELRAMQNDPRYYRDKDPAFIKKVTDGYNRLYKGR